jgi:hypothetical protein
MTDKIVYDYFPLPMRDFHHRFFAVLVKSIVLETADENRTQEYHRGIYSFRSRDARNSFTTLCNGVNIETVAYRFNLQPMEK